MKQPIDERDTPPTEQEAIEAGVALLAANWNGKSDFDKGMRMLQKQLGIRHKKKARKHD